MKDSNLETKVDNSTKNDLEIISFDSQTDWEVWLSQNCTTSKGIWIRFYKKSSGICTIVYDEALDVALCYGWIDGQVNRLDDNSYIQKFTPCRPKSM